MQKKIEDIKIDKHVGGRLRQARTMRGFSQKQLAEKLDITFQQIQKYEKGKNRIASSKLFTLSHILQLPLTYFFEGLKKPEVTDFPFKMTLRNMKLLKKFETLSDEHQKIFLNIIGYMPEQNSNSAIPHSNV